MSKKISIDLSKDEAITLLSTLMACNEKAGTTAKGVNEWRVKINSVMTKLTDGLATYKRNSN